ncbi:MAG: hypothetical protein RSA23_08100 [Carnobacterium sp.]
MMWKVLTGAENDYDLFANEPIASLKKKIVRLSSKVILGMQFHTI